MLEKEILEAMREAELIHEGEDMPIICAMLKLDMKPLEYYQALCDAINQSVLETQGYSLYIDDKGAPRLMLRYKGTDYHIAYIRPENNGFGLRLKVKEPEWKMIKGLPVMISKTENRFNELNELVAEGFGPEMESTYLGNARLIAEAAELVRSEKYQP